MPNDNDGCGHTHYMVRLVLPLGEIAPEGKTMDEMAESVINNPPSMTVECDCGETFAMTPDDCTDPIDGMNAWVSTHHALNCESSFAFEVEGLNRDPS